MGRFVDKRILKILEGLEDVLVETMFNLPETGVKKVNFVDGELQIEYISNHTRSQEAILKCPL